MLSSLAFDGGVFDPRWLIILLRWLLAYSRFQYHLIHPFLKNALQTTVMAYNVRRQRCAVHLGTLFLTLGLSLVIVGSVAGADWSKRRTGDCFSLAAL